MRVRRRQSESLGAGGGRGGAEQHIVFRGRQRGGNEARQNGTTTMYGSPAAVGSG